MKYKLFSPNKSVVKVFVTKSSYNYLNPWAAPTQMQSYASGFIIDGRRIVTNAHVVSNVSFVQVRKAGSSRKYEARIRRVVHAVDLAILEISDEEGRLEEFFDNTAPLVLGQTPSVGDTVRAYGFPWGGNEMSLTKGVVSRVEVDRVAHSGGAVLACDMDTAITGGNSGGPVMAIPGDDHWRSPCKEPVVVGVVFQGYSAKEGGYMIAVEVVRRVIALDNTGQTLKVPELGITAQILENRCIRKSLGLVSIDKYDQGLIKSLKSNAMKVATRTEQIDKDKEIAIEITPEQKELADSSKKIEGGIMVYKIADFSPAKGLLKKRDVLLQIDDFPIGENGTVEFRKGERTKWTYCIARKCIGESVKLKFFRDGYFYTHTIVLDKTRNDIQHVGEKQYDVKPTYMLKAGFVFQPVTLNLYHAITCFHSVHSKLLEYRSTDHPSYVLMTRVLQCDITTGYDMTSQIVEAVNGKVIHTMQDLIDAFKEEIEVIETKGDSNNPDASLNGILSSTLNISDNIDSSATDQPMAESSKHNNINKDIVQEAEEKEYCIELYSGNVISIVTRDIAEDTKIVARKYDIKETEFIGDN